MSFAFDDLLDHSKAVWRRFADLGFEQLDRRDQMFFLVWSLEGEVNNGGFDQYFFNSSGDYARHVVAALQELGAPQTAEIAAAACDAFPGDSIPKDLPARRQALERLTERQATLWSNLDSQFYARPEDIDQLLHELISNPAA